jgi:predicted ABC-type ATPase
VLAGANGAGKSSLGGELLIASGGSFFNPDAHARRIRELMPELDVAEANAMAWNQGRAGLERAIAMRGNYAFETTLGGQTIAALLVRAGQSGLAVRVWFVGLAHAGMNVLRVHARVLNGGHDIPEEDIRRRYDAGRSNLVRLLPVLDELRVYDNSVDADPSLGRSPQPRLLLHVVRQQMLGPADLAATPGWAKAIVVAAIKLAAAVRQRPGE